MTECERCRRWVDAWIAVDCDRAPELSLVLCPACLTAILRRIEQELEPDPAPAEQCSMSLHPVTRLPARFCTRTLVLSREAIERVRQGIGDAPGSVHLGVRLALQTRSFAPVGALLNMLQVLAAMR